MDGTVQSTPADAGRTENERRVLSAVQAAGALASAEIARQTGLSAQSASVLTRTLEADGLLLRGAPQKGKVGKPLVPISLNPGGAFAFGLRIGRRRTDLVLMDLCGAIRGRRIANHPYPTPDNTLKFLRKGIDALSAGLTPDERARLSGIGIGAPFELWNWLDIVGAPKREMMVWKDFSFARAIPAFTDLPVFAANDATLACAAEQVFGTGRGEPDYAYFLVSTFIGGGLVLDGKVWPGPTGNAGAFGSIPTGGSGAAARQLIHDASIYVLEQRLSAAGFEATDLREHAASDPEVARIVAHWITDCARAIAEAALAAVAIIDTGLVIVDTALTGDVSDRLAHAVRDEIRRKDNPGIRIPRVISGKLGGSAGPLGAAYLPIAGRYMVGSSRLAIAPVAD